MKMVTTDRTPAGNSTYKKLAVQWLNEALCSVSSFVVADSFRLRNRQLLGAAKRYATPQCAYPQGPTHERIRPAQFRRAEGGSFGGPEEAAKAAR